jgi:hypothetical protein
MHPSIDVLRGYTCTDVAQLIWEFVEPPQTVEQLLHLITPPLLRANRMKVRAPRTRLRWKAYSRDVYEVLRPCVYDFARFTEDRMIHRLFGTLLLVPTIQADVRHTVNCVLGTVADKLLEYYPYVTVERQYEIIQLWAQLGIHLIPAFGL